MKSINIYLAVLLLGFVLPFQIACAAVTNVVLPGESIQAMINISADGDTVAIFGGTYSEDLVVTQAVRLAEVSGQDVTINGSLLISGVTNAPPLQGFVIGSSGRGLVVSNTPGILLQSLNILGTGFAAWGNTSADIQDCQISGIAANEASLSIIDSDVIGSINKTDGSLNILSSYISGSISQSAGCLYIANSTVGGNIAADNPSSTSVVYRCTVTNDIYLGIRGVIAYSQARRISSTTTNAILDIVGCRFNRGIAEVHVVQINGVDSKVLVANCEINTTYHEILGTPDDPHYYGIYIGSAGSRGFIVNNYIDGTSTGAKTENTGIHCAGADIEVINNIIKTKANGIRAPFGTTIKGNCVYNCPTRYTGGGVASDDLNTDPKYDLTLHSLQPDSPCIDGGTTDPRYRDRDGSRSDTGPTGGSWYDPSGWTSDVPVVVSFDLSTDQYLEGTLAEIVLSGGSAVSIP